MDFWLGVVIIVITIPIIEIVRDVVKKRAIASGKIGDLHSEINALQQDIDIIKKDIEEIKGYMADLVIKSAA